MQNQKNLPDTDSISLEDKLAYLDNQKVEYEDTYQAEHIFNALHEIATKGKTEHEMNFFPVSPETFLLHEKYLGQKDVVYPVVLEEYKEINSGKYVELVATGGIGSAKTTVGLYTLAYQLYRVSLYTYPHKIYGLDPSTEILFIFQNKTEALARAVDYSRFKQLIDNSNYFKHYFKYDSKVNSMLKFPNRIEVRPVSGQQTAAIGLNVIAGLIDELNYMDKTVGSKRAIADDGDYDQAIAVYNSIARRRKSRFNLSGPTPGILCLVSSRRYPGQFTDIKEEEAKKDKTIYVYDHTVWEIKPKGFFSGETFPVYKGSPVKKPFIVTDDHDLNAEEQQSVIEVPLEYRKEFEADIYDALREIAGIALRANSPFIPNIDAILDSFGHHDSIFNRPEIVFGEHTLRLIKENFKYKHQPRFIHLDLGIKRDALGMCVGTVSGFTKQDRGEGHHEALPLIHIDGTLRIIAPKNGEIELSKIRNIIYKIIELGIHVRWVTLDSYQSVDTIQILRAKGVTASLTSVDKTVVPYTFTKSALYDGRIKAPSHDHLVKELNNLQFDAVKRKIDHPPKGTKDVSDALAGVVYGLTTRNLIWSMHGEEVASSVVESIRSEARKEEEDTQAQALKLLQRASIVR